MNDNNNNLSKGMQKNKKATFYHIELYYLKNKRLHKVLTYKHIKYIQKHILYFYINIFIV
jgi:hypothetical protein